MLIAAVVSIPFGVLGGVYLAEISPEGPVARAVRFCAKMLTGLPSILAGVFAFSLVVLYWTHRPSPFAGGVALALLMLPTAAPGILTGVLLALSRAAGDTAPLLFTTTFSDYWMSRNPVDPTASLAVLIFNFSKSPFENQKEIAWAAALVLVLIVLVLNLGGQALSRRFSGK